MSKINFITMNEWNPCMINKTALNSMISDKLEQQISQTFILWWGEKVKLWEGWKEV